MANQNIDIVARMVDEVSSTAGQIGKSVNDLKPVFTGMAVAGTAAFAAVSAGIYMSVKAASDAQAEIAKFNAILNASGNASDTVRKQLLDASKAVTQLGFDDEAAAVSLAKFYQRTNDVADAQKLLNISMDLARAKNIDLESATNLVNLALSGSGRALLQYGISIKDSATPLEALGVLQQKVGGQAIAFSETFAGKLAALNEQTTNVKEAIGNALLPILTELLTKIQPVITKILDWVEANPELTRNIIILVAAVTGLTAVIGTAGVAILAFQAVSFPVIAIILAIVVAITALIVIGYELYTHWGELKALAIDVWNSIGQWITDKMQAVGDFLTELWSGISDFFKKIWNGITDIFKFAVALEVGLVIEAFQAMGIDIFAVFATIQDFFFNFWIAVQEVFANAMAIARSMWQTFWLSLQTFLAPVIKQIQDTITAVWKWIADTFETASKPIVDVWASMWQGIQAAATVAMEVVKATITAALNFVINKINAIINAINSVASKGAKGLGISIPQIPTIPLLADGGVVTKPTLAMIGEAGAEAVIPLSKMGGLGGGLVININGGTYLDRDVAQKIGDMIIDNLKLNIRI